MHAPCTQIAPLLYDYVRHGLPKDQAARVALHFRDCVYCRADHAVLADKSNGMTMRRLGWRGWSLLVLGCVLLLLLGSLLLGLMLQDRLAGWPIWQPEFRVESRLFGQSASQNNLQHWAVIFRVYSGENRGRFPPVAPYDGVWAPDLRSLYPDYLHDLSMLVSPKRRDARELRATLASVLAQTPPDWRLAATIVAQSYTYTGWHVDALADFDRLQTGRDALYQEGVVGMASDQVLPLLDHDSDFRDGEHFMPRLREGVERFYITDVNNPEAAAEAARNIVVLFETPDPTGEEASRRHFDVLYMDGHVSRVRYGAAFPILPEVTALLADDDGQVEN